MQRFPTGIILKTNSENFSFFKENQTEILKLEIPTLSGQAESIVLGFLNTSQSLLSCNATNFSKYKEILRSLCMSSVHSTFAFPPPIYLFLLFRPVSSIYLFIGPLVAEFIALVRTSLSLADYQVLSIRNAELTKSVDDFLDATEEAQKNPNSHARVSALPA